MFSFVVLSMISFLITLPLVQLAFTLELFVLVGFLVELFCLVLSLLCGNGFDTFTLFASNDD